jgi:hypothetical protein
MAHIYANSYVTIAAASATSVSEGFLQTRETRMQDPKWFPLAFACRNGQMGMISVRDHFVYRAVKEPINHRAWTLQEDILSPCVLSYGSYHMGWQCSGARRRDDGLESELEHCQGLNKRVFLGSHHPRLPKSGEEGSEELGAWLAVLEEYS